MSLPHLVVYGTPGWIRGEPGAASSDEGWCSGVAGVGCCSSLDVSGHDSSTITRRDWLAAAVLARRC